MTGVADGHFARVVRADPVREGLLFLGTEHGPYLSFDDGDSWQSLQLELPDTPIRDLVIKDYDVVLGTHGRGFWILDDIDFLRQVTPEVLAKPIHLVPPHPAYRRAQDAVIQYHLAAAAETVQIEILDDSGAVLADYRSDAEEGRKPGAKAGLNRFTWDLRYPGATSFEGMIIWSGRPQRGPMAPPGTYRVRVTAGEEQVEAPFEVRMDPRLVDVTEADLREQFDLALQIRDQTSRANEAVIAIRALRAQANERSEDLDAAASQRVQDWLARLQQVEEALYQTKNRSGQDPLNFPIRLNNRLASLRRSVETGEARPTNGAYQVFGELRSELDGHMDSLSALTGAGLEAINEVLGQAGKEPIAIEGEGTR